MVKIVDTTDEWITTRTGIKERRYADEKTATSDLAIVAAKEALHVAGLGAKDLQAIVVATATPDMFFPSTACLVQRGLEANQIMSFDITAGCSGFVYALGVADALIKSGLDNILVIGADILTRITDFKDRATCVLFGDAAGAVTLCKPKSQNHSIIDTYFASDGSFGEYLYMPGGGSRMPTSIKTVEERLHYIKMEGNEVFKLAVRMMADASLKVLKKANLKPEDVSLLIPHQANYRIIDATAKRLHLPDEKVFVNVDRYGNTSAASIPVALDEALQQDRIKKGDIVLLVAFGSGFTWGSVLIKW